MTQITNWHEYFMRMAELVSLKSKDRSTKVGAVITDDDHNVLSVGYNGFPRGVNDTVEDRHTRPAKYLYTEHAERNAIYAAARNGVRLKNCNLYVTGGAFGCADCARAMIQAGIKCVVGMFGCFDGKDPRWAESCEIAKLMYDEAGVNVIALDAVYEPSVVTASTRPKPPTADHAYYLTDAVKVVSALNFKIDRVILYAQDKTMEQANIMCGRNLERAVWVKATHTVQIFDPPREWCDSFLAITKEVAKESWAWAVKE